jgi:hypothetical protein
MTEREKAISDERYRGHRQLARQVERQRIDERLEKGFWMLDEDYEPAEDEEDDE